MARRYGEIHHLRPGRWLVRWTMRNADGKRVSQARTVYGTRADAERALRVYGLTKRFSVWLTEAEHAQALAAAGERDLREIAREAIVEWVRRHRRTRH